MATSFIRKLTLSLLLSATALPAMSDGLSGSYLAARQATYNSDYEAAARYCAQVGDHDSRLFFEGLLEEERRHGEALAAWLEALRQPVPASREPRVTF